MARRSTRHVYNPPAPPSAAEIRNRDIGAARATVACTKDGMDWFGKVYGIYATRDRAKAELDKWAAAFAQNPARELEWSVGTFENAATLKVAETIIYHHERGVSSHEILQELQEEIRRASRRGLSRSTSPTSNLMEDAMREANVKFAEQLASHLNHVEQAQLLLAGVEMGIA